MLEMDVSGQALSISKKGNLFLRIVTEGGIMMLYIRIETNVVPTDITPISNKHLKIKIEHYLKGDGEESLNRK